MGENPDSAYWTAICDRLDAAFDRDALRALCIDLGLAYGDLPGKSKRARAHALVASELGRTAEAISIAREVIRADLPEVVLTGAFVALLESLRREGRTGEAVQAADEMARCCSSEYGRSIAGYERAIEVAPDFGGVISVGLQRAARDGYNTMRLLGQRMATTKLPSTLPIGSGNEGNNLGLNNGHFYPESEQEILAESTGAIGLENNTNG